MAKLFIIAALFVTVLSFVPVPFKPDFNHAHNAFVCNGTICKDKTSVLPVAWQRYAP